GAEGLMLGAPPAPRPALSAGPRGAGGRKRRAGSRARLRAELRAAILPPARCRTRGARPEYCSRDHHGLRTLGTLGEGSGGCRRRRDVSRRSLVEKLPRGGLLPVLARPPDSAT